MAGASFGLFAKEYSSFASDIDLNAEAGPSRNILVMAAASGGLVLRTATGRTIALTDLAAGDTVTMTSDKDGGFMKILSGGTSIAKCRVSW
jgi:hypothetical protein